MFARLAHLQKITVVKGQLVKKGDLVGTVGTGAGQYSAHLHADFPREKLDAWTNYVFGISKGGVEHLYADPKPYQETVAPWQHHFGWNYLEWAAYGERHCYHPGADYNGKGAGNADLGLPVYAPFDGKVVYCYDENGKNAGWGKLLVIESMQSTPKPMQNNDNLRILDLSHWNIVTDWSKIKDPVILKCTEGLDYEDQTFRERSKRHNFYGSYHFFRDVDINKQVDFYLKTLGKAGGIIVLDFEIECPDAQNKCNKFLDRIREKTGEIPYLYTNEARANKYEFNYPLWIARYGTNDGTPQKEPTKPCKIWQYTSRGKVDGIKGNVDLNIARNLPLEASEIQEPIEVPKPVENPTTGQIEGNNDTPSDVVQVHEAEKPTPTFIPLLVEVLINLIKKTYAKIIGIFRK
jgi:GH25 family lysozyme M1 (1,4-beta-N-acetylmuramidase)